MHKYVTLVADVMFVQHMMVTTDISEEEKSMTKRVRMSPRSA